MGYVKIATTNDELMSWYTGPLTEEHIAELRFKLGKVRGVLIQVIQSIESRPDLEELKQILEETASD